MATWPPPFLQGLQAASQPFFVQTPYGVCLYVPSTGACSPPINPAAFTATNMPPHPQQQPAAPTAPPLPPPAATAQPPPPPSPPPAIDVFVEQSTFSPSPEMVDALSAMSKFAWRFRSDLRPMQVRINGTLHECPLFDGVVITINHPPPPPAPVASVVQFVSHCMRMVRDARTKSRSTSPTHNENRLRTVSILTRSW